MLPKPDLPHPFPTKAIWPQYPLRGGFLRGLRARAEVAPAQGAIPGIPRFGTRERRQEWVEREIL